MKSVGFSIDGASRVTMEDCVSIGFDQGYEVKNTEDFVGRRLKALQANEVEQKFEKREAVKRDFLGKALKTSTSFLAVASGGLGIYERGQKTGLW